MPHCLKDHVYENEVAVQMRFWSRKTRRPYKSLLYTCIVYNKFKCRIDGNNVKFNNENC